MPMTAILRPPWLKTVNGFRMVPMRELFGALGSPN
jgi:hypothetical protein